jgi:hypothetical protein
MPGTWMKALAAWATPFRDLREAMGWRMYKQWPTATENARGDPLT